MIHVSRSYKSLSRTDLISDGVTTTLEATFEESDVDTEDIDWWVDVTVDEATGEVVIEIFVGDEVHVDDVGDVVKANDVRKGARDAVDDYNEEHDTEYKTKGELGWKHTTCTVIKVLHG